MRAHRLGSRGGDRAGRRAKRAVVDPQDGVHLAQRGGDERLVQAREVPHALRRLLRRGQISAERAHDARTDFAELTLVRYPHEPVNDRVWELRENLTACDATFVALAEALNVPIGTCDARLAANPPPL